MRKVISLILMVCLLFSFMSIAEADSIKLTTIKTRDTFSYNDSKNTDWTYYQYAEKTTADGTYVEILVVDWGNNIEASGYPEFRIFASTKANEDIIVQTATFMIDGNMFELTFDELTLDKSHGALFYLASDAVPFMKSLATAENVSAILRYNGETTSVAFNANEIAPVGQFASDLLNIDFLNHIVSTESNYENWYKEKTPIISYVFNPVDIAEPLNDTIIPGKANDDGWFGHPLKDIGVTFFLPENYTVYTRGMNATDPVVKALGMTPAEIDQALADGNYYLEASQDDFVSEVFVTMIDSTINDFATWSDSGLLGMSALWTSAYQSYGIEILDTDIYTTNGVKYIRMHEKQTADDGNIMYKIQYYTTVNYQAINFVFISNYDEVSETEKEFMQSVVERVVFDSAAALNTTQPVATPSPIPQSTTAPAMESANQPDDEQPYEPQQVVLLGSYEQDYNLNNGKEPVEWIILAQEGDRTLLLSRYCLFTRIYHEKKEQVSWGQSDIRHYLNSDFLNDCFTQDERRLILETSNFDGQNESKDYLFCLSEEEAIKYLPSAEMRRTAGTQYAKGNTEYNYGSVSPWWLRSTAKPFLSSAWSASDVWSSGNIGYDNIRCRTILVRPALWVNTTSIQGKIVNTPVMTESSIPSIIGKEICFGHYEQDDNRANGTEGITWLVVDYDDGNALLVSKSIIDRKAYNDVEQDVTWQTSSIRLWLNNDFLRLAFTESEKAQIVDTAVDNSDAQGCFAYSTYGGKNTVDKVFLLSYAEAYRYFADDNSRIAFSTPSTVAGGAYVDSHTGGTGWWLRSPGFKQKSGTYIMNDGSYFSNTATYLTGIRPAMWVKLDLSILE